MSIDHAPDQSSSVRDRRRGRLRPVGPFLLWFAVLGGTVAWAVSLGTDWSVTELACISPAEGPWMDNRGGTPSVAAWAAVTAGAVVPWLVALAAFVACLVVRRRHRRLREAGEVDTLASERVGLLVVLGTFLNLFALAAISGGIVAMLVLDVCG